MDKINTLFILMGSYFHSQQYPYSSDFRDSTGKQNILLLKVITMFQNCKMLYELLKFSLS